MKHFSFLFMAVSFLIACGSKDDKKTVEEIPFKSEKILIDTVFPPYDDPSVTEILQEIGMCVISSDTTLADSLQMPLCKHEWFRIFKNTNDPSWKKGFIVEIKEGIYSHVPQVVNVVPANGKFKVTNSYKGALLEMRTTPSGCYDLIIRYIDSAVGTIAILHVWENNKYVPATVVEVNDHYVKEEKMDSLNAIYIDEFVWGY